jgi:hypothetical protein
MAVLTRLYDTREDAIATVKALESAGMGHDEISVIGGNQTGQYGANGASNGAANGASTTTVDPDTAAKAAGAGATAGTIIGGGTGLMAGLGALAIPGLGPVVAAGWIVAALTGAGVGAAVGGGAGGLIGSLTTHGVSEDDAHIYAEGVRRGGFLVTAKVDDKRVSEAQRILSSRGVDVAQRRSVYAQEGWSRFDESAPPYETTSASTQPRL